MRQLELQLSSELPNPEQLASALINDLLEDSTPITIFLDDFHLITDDKTSAALALLIEYMPANVSIVIGSRDVPNMHMDKLRARGTLRLVSWNDLQFTVGEVREYFLECLDIALSDDAARKLVSATEGWITGIQLAVATMGNQGKIDFDEITGTRIEIGKYLFSEVFSKQSEDVRHFLLQTSLVEQFSSPLCNAITGRQDSHLLIEKVDRLNLFIVRLGPDGSWFRYHHLFNSFLRERLQTERPNEIEEIALRAIKFLEDQKMLEEAFHLAIRVKLYGKAADLLVHFGRSLFADGAFREVDRHIAMVPESLISTDARLCILHAWALCYLGNTDSSLARISQARTIVKHSESVAAKEEMTTLLAEISVLSSIVGVVQRDEPDLGLERRGILSEIDASDLLVQGFANVALGRIARVQSKLDDSVGYYRHVGTLAQLARSPLLAHLSVLNRSVLLRLQGRLAESEAHLRSHLALSAERRWLRSAPAAFIRVQHAINLFDMHLCAEGLAELADALNILEANRTYGFYGLALIERARNLDALRRTNDAWKDIRSSWAMAVDQNAPRVHAQADLLAARLAANAGDYETASEYIARADRSGSAGGNDVPALRSEIQELAMIESVRLLLLRDEPVAAFRHSRTGLVSANSAGRIRYVLEFLALQAVAFTRMRRPEQAIRKLIGVFDLMRDESFVSLLIFPDVDMRGPLTQAAVSCPRNAARIRRILESLDSYGQNGGAKSPVPMTGDVPRLHVREEQILRLLATGMRNNAIAVRLGISDETVKWYLKSLFAKLEASNRTEAVSLARRLRIL
ncbi:LuxR C-terminal-related transcriptional regulator [Mesorhizobium sp. B2-4-13]|uniref:LuxR C-terminal-related transcriptional regulator n=1 Tax=Mesorhizobium sp. B2-4-13 TaxID=2589936 RepID=UPI0015EE9DB8|nr:LuxR C-terminal-related transcriptional regulator [Mesorhizobium sp. B2-4-13]